MCIDTIGSVVHDSANIEIMQSKFIDCMWFKNTVKRCGKPVTPKSGRGRLKMVVQEVPTTGLLLGLKFWCFESVASYRRYSLTRS